MKKFTSEYNKEFHELIKKKGNEVPTALHCPYKKPEPGSGF